MDQEENIDSQQASEIVQSSEIKFTPSQPGSVRCRAKNRMGSDNAIGQVKLGDLEKPSIITGLKEDQKIAIGDYVRLECGAIIYNYSSAIIWHKNGDQVDDAIVEETNTKFSWRKTLTWKSITMQDEGNYECEIPIKDSEETETLSVDLVVHEAEAPIITSNFNQSVLLQTLGASLRLDCLVSGLPVPSLLWWKNDELFKGDEINSDEKGMQRIMIDENNSSITFSVLRLEDTGNYRCVARNRIGHDFKEVRLEIPRKLIHH